MTCEASWLIAPNFADEPFNLLPLISAKKAVMGQACFFKSDLSSALFCVQSYPYLPCSIPSKYLIWASHWSKLKGLSYSIPSFDASLLFLFTPIPCTYTSLPLDSMAKNYFYFLHGYARSCNLSCLDPFYSYHLIPEERKNLLVWAGIEPRSSCFTSDHSNH